MVYKKIFLTFVGFVLVIITETSFSRVIKKRTKWSTIPYDSLVLSLNYCPYYSEFCQKNHLLYLTVHGLWPTNRTKIDTVAECSKADLKLPNFFPRGLFMNLTSFWPSYKKSKDSITFWNDEFKKHGYCYTKAEYNSADPILYLRDTMEIYHSLHIPNLIYYIIGKGYAFQTSTNEIIIKLNNLDSALFDFFGVRNFKVLCLERNEKNYFTGLKLYFDEDKNPLKKSNFQWCGGFDSFVYILI